MDTKELIDEAIRLYNDKASIEDIAKAVNRHRNTVHRWFKEKQVKLHKRGKYTFDETFFDMIDTEEKAYCLGFIYADGCNNLKGKELDITLHPKDVDILLKINTCFKNTCPLKTVYRKKADGSMSEYTKLSLFSVPMCKRLTELGSPPAKTAILEYPEWMLADLDRHFIRGYFDGDGSVGRHGGKARKNRNYCLARVVSTDSFLRSVQQRINVRSSIVPCNSTSHVKMLCMSGKYALDFLDWMYKDATIYLDRKYRLYQELKTIN